MFQLRYYNLYLFFFSFTTSICVIKYLSSKSLDFLVLKFPDKAVWLKPLVIQGRIIQPFLQILHCSKSISSWEHFMSVYTIIITNFILFVLLRNFSDRFLRESVSSLKFFFHPKLINYRFRLIKVAGVSLTYLRC